MAVPIPFRRRASKPTSDSSAPPSADSPPISDAWRSATESVQQLAGRKPKLARAFVRRVQKLVRTLLAS